MTTTTALLVTACGGSTGSSGMSGTDHNSMSMPNSASNGMPGMDDMPTGDGLAAESAGFRFAPAASSLPAGQPGSFQFRITGTSGTPVTTFEPDQTKLMHFYLIRTDLTGFQHVHPTLGGNGTWTAPLAAAQPGTYRAYASFITKNTSGKTMPLVLSQQITIPGTAPTTPLPAASTTAKVDGYTLTLASDQLTAGMQHQLTVTVSKHGQPATDLQPYLDTYAHLTAFHDGDLSFAHLHPHGTVNGDHGGPALSFEAMLPKSGNWRLFLQFQTGGILHTAAATVTVG
ncbi:MAG: hypothetical protein ACRDTH_04890 [Pseudonocardiaceae bacterium]